MVTEQLLIQSSTFGYLQGVTDLCHLRRRRTISRFLGIILPLKRVMSDMRQTLVGIIIIM
jgi:hypothetical protein